MGQDTCNLKYVSSCKSSQTFFLALAFYVLSRRISSRDQFRIHAQCWALLIGGPCTGEYRLFLHEVETYLALCRVRIPTVPRSCPVGFDR